MKNPFKTYRVRHHQGQYIPEYRLLFGQWQSYRHQGETVWFRTLAAALDYIHQQAPPRASVGVYEQQG